MVCLLQTATLHIEVDDLIAVLVDVGEGQSHQLPVRQLLSLIASSSSHLLRERTRVLRLAIQHTDPRIVAQHVPVGRDGGLHHLLIGHHIDESLVIIWEVGSHGQTVLLLLLVELQVQIAQLIVFTLSMNNSPTPHRFHFPAGMRSLLRLPRTLALELEGQHVLVVDVVVIVNDHALADQLAVIVAALIPHSSRNFHGKESPLPFTAANKHNGVIHTQLNHLLQKQVPVLRRPCTRRLLLSGVVKPVVVLVRVLEAVLEATLNSSSFSHALIRASLQPNSFSCLVDTFVRWK